MKRLLRQHVIVAALIAMSALPLVASAQVTPTQTLNNNPTGQPSVNINDSGFRLVVCDGPHNPAGDPQGYIPCDFNGMMLQVQHLINVAIVVGVLLAIVGFCYAGWLLIIHGNEPGKRSEAADIFKKVGIGFILMLSAWFIVYQILVWLTGSNSGFTALLGSPK